MTPILFQGEGFVIPAYPVMLALGTCALVWLSTLAAERNGLPRHHMALLLVGAYVAGLGGARLLFVVEHYWLYADPVKAAFSPFPGGFASHGSFFFGTAAAILYAKRFRLPLGKVADSAAIGLCVFGALMRLGCFLGSCCYGRPTQLPWGVIFPQGSEPATRWGFGVPVHPTQLYEAGYLIGIAALLLLMEKRYRFAGEKFLWLVLAYSVARFLNEFVRGDSLLEFWSLTPPQWMSLAIIVTALGSMNFAKKPSRSAASIQATA